MAQSIVELLSRQHQRVDALATLAGRFLDTAMKASLERLSTRLSRLAAVLATPEARARGTHGRLGGQLERLVREVGLLRLDDPEAVTHVAWSLADIEETIAVTQLLDGPVYTAN